MYEKINMERKRERNQKDRFEIRMVLVFNFKYFFKLSKALI